jgi:hypothetical protein
MNEQSVLDGAPDDEAARPRLGTGERRFDHDDDCPLFSERLEEHLVAVTRGEQPNAGRFCGHCYTPMSPERERCPHCDEDARTGRPPLAAVPDEVLAMLRRQRKTERAYVTGYAYLGLGLAIIGGLALVLGLPPLRDNLIAATITYGLFLFIGGRTLAGILGGGIGDRKGYEKARSRLCTDWAEWLPIRDDPPPPAGDPPEASTTAEG